MPKDRHQVLLLTEDKKDFRKNIRGLLENRGYGFIEAESLQFVMDILKHEDTDLILVDRLEYIEAGSGSLEVGVWAAAVTKTPLA